jgi:hypothetical protein
MLPARGGSIHIRNVREPTAKSSANGFGQRFAVRQRVEDRDGLVGSHSLIGRRWEPHLPAYAMAHEIGHGLQATDWHAEAGVMKAERDYAAMEKGRLGFTSAGRKR